MTIVHHIDFKDAFDCIIILTFLGYLYSVRTYTYIRRSRMYGFALLFSYIVPV